MLCFSWKIRGTIFLILYSMVTGVILWPAAAFAVSAHTAYDPGVPVVVTEPVYIVSNDSIGLDARNGGSISTAHDVAVSGDRSYGSYAIDGSALNIAGNVKVSGDLSTAVYVGDNSSAVVEGDVSMFGNGKANNTLGYRSFSLYADGGEVTVGGSISTSGDLSTALYAKGSAITVYGNVTADGNGTTNPTIGDGSHAINAVNSVIRVSGNVITNGENNFGVNVAENSLVYIDGQISTKGDRVQGVNARGNSEVNVSGDITSDGTSTIAINAANGAVVNAGRNVTALDSGHLATGVHAVSASKVNVSGDITAKGTEFGNGIEAFNVGTAVTVDGSVIAESEKWVRAVEAEGSIVTVGGNVSAKGVAVEPWKVAEAIFAYDKARVSVGGNVEAEGIYMIGAMDTNYSTINIGGNVSVSGERTWGVYSWENASIDVAGNVSAIGSEATGAYTYDNASVTIGGDVNAVGEEATGIWATKNGRITVDGNVGVNGNESYGAYVTSNSVISVDGRIDVEGNSSYGAYVSSSRAAIGGVRTTGSGTTGVRALSSVVNITGDVDVTGNNTCGVYASSSSTVTVRDSVMNSSGTDSTLIRVERSVVSLDNVAGSADGRALLYTTSSGDVYAENGTALTGNVLNNNSATTGAALNLRLDGAASLTGTVNDAGSRALTNFSLTGAGDAWHVTGASTIRGSLDNSGVVNYMLSPAFTDVTVGHLGANGGTGGTYIMKADVARQIADNLVVTQTTSGSYKITVNNDGSAATTGEELTTLVRTADQDGSFSLSHLVEAGAWQYGLRQVTYAGGNAIWELYANGAPSNPGSDAVNSFYASYLLGYAHMETLIKRLGDLRETPDESGVWARLHGGKFESKAGSYARAFDMKYWGVHVGYDRKLEYKGWEGDSYAGIFLGWGKGDIDYLALGDGDAELKEVGVYGTWLHPNGFFADLVFKYQWIDNDFRAFDSAGDIVTGSGMTTGGLGGSLELGQRIHFSDRDGNGRKIGWYIEPQVQLSIMRYKGDYFRVTSSMVAGADGFTSIIGRLGALVGYENESKTANFYLKAFRLREFEADINAYINGLRISDSYKGSWWVYGLGYTGKINDRDSVYLDIERTSGAKFDQLWSARLGWRRTF